MTGIGTQPQKHVARYREDVESWRDDHDRAEACHDFETLLSFGIFVQGLIEDADRDWRAAMAAGRVEFSEATETAILGLFRSWLCASEEALRGLEYFESQGFDVERAREFRKLVKRTKAAHKFFDESE